MRSIDSCHATQWMPFSLRFYEYDYANAFYANTYFVHISQRLIAIQILTLYLHVVVVIITVNVSIDVVSATTDEFVFVCQNPGRTATEVIHDHDRCA